MSSRLPWWMRDASPEEKRLYFANCPHSLWQIELEDLPVPTTILYGEGKNQIRITAKDQREWMQRVAKGLNDPLRVLIVSGPTDLPGLALMTWWCKQPDPMNLIDLGAVPEPADVPETALGVFNMTDSSTPDRVQAARDILYRYKDRLVALCVSGPTDPIEYSREVLRFYKFHAIFHLEGIVAIDRRRKK